MTTIDVILSKISHVRFHGRSEDTISRAYSLLVDRPSSDGISWCNEKNVERIKEVSEGTLIIPRDLHSDLLQSGVNYIESDNPRKSFQEVLQLFFVPHPKVGVSKTAVISESATIGDNVFIGEHVVVGDHCEIGSGSRILHNTVLFDDVRIGANVVVGANCTVGGVGFGYEKNSGGEFELIPHIGGVVIEDHVEIGNNTCIDRAVMGNTRVRKNAKIDNLVHIAHGVDVGENSVVIANAMVAGSCKIGRDSWIAPSSSVLNKVDVGDSCLIGLGAVVLKNVEDGQTIIGNPGKVLTPRGT